MDLELKEVELETKEEQLEAQKLENAKMLLEVLKEAEAQGFNTEDVLKQFEMLQDLDKSLHFETKENRNTCVETGAVDAVETKVE